MAPRRQAQPPQIKYRVCYHLARAVVCCLAAAEGGVVFCFCTSTFIIITVGFGVGVFVGIGEERADRFEGGWEGQSTTTTITAIGVSASAGV